ncbi:MAG TPA: hypothetical protein VG603_10680 [Chitinophagales bacterium]|nr:hypothetical protein [Chitinophagales bacterium]
MDEDFICEACGRRWHINRLKRRDTMPGNYCTACAAYEECAACGERYKAAAMKWQSGLQVYICAGCLPHLHEVAAYLNGTQKKGIETVHKEYSMME